MIYILDTNILIYLIKNKPPAIAAHINTLNANDALCMSFVTYAELLKGAEKHTRKSAVIQQLNQLTQSIPVKFEANAELCSCYAEQFTQLKAAGTPISANGLWIACHALSIKATLVTHNVREFERINNLAIEGWAN